MTDPAAAPDACVLDGCVLVPACLRDTVLRLAEEPALYLPRWSDQIIEEMVRTLRLKLNVGSAQTDHLAVCLRDAFPEAWITDFEPLIAGMANEPKDRHVLAAAARAGAQTIVTFNTKHFPKAALDPWGIEAQSPDDFLMHLYHLNPRLTTRRLLQEAADTSRTLPELLSALGIAAPGFEKLLAADGHG